MYYISVDREHRKTHIRSSNNSFYHDVGSLKDQERGGASCNEDQLKTQTGNVGYVSSYMLLFLSLSVDA